MLCICNGTENKYCQLYPYKPLQDRQYMCNMTLRCFRITIVAMEKQQVLCIPSVCLWPQLSSIPSACIVLYCHFWPVSLNNIFPLYLVNGMIFRKQFLDVEHAFWFSVHLLSETFFFPGIIQQYVIIIMHTFLCNVPLFLSELCEFSQQILKNYSLSKFLENMSCGN